MVGAEGFAWINRNDPSPAPRVVEVKEAEEVRAACVNEHLPGKALDGFASALLDVLPARLQNPVAMHGRGCTGTRSVKRGRESPPVGIAPRSAPPPTTPPHSLKRPITQSPRPTPAHLSTPPATDVEHFKKRRFELTASLDSPKSNSGAVGPKLGYIRAEVDQLFMKYHALNPAEPLLPAQTGPGARLYCEEGDQTSYISGAGMERLQADIGWPDEANSGIVAFFFLLGTRYVRVISREEWHSGFKALGAASLDGAKERCLRLHQEIVKDQKLHQQYFCYSFKFAVKEGQKALPRLTAQKLLLLLAGTSPFALQFTQYLNDKNIQSMNYDQWRNFIPFSNEIDPLYSNYSDAHAWPTLYDGFVLWSTELTALQSPQETHKKARVL